MGKFSPLSPQKASEQILFLPLRLSSETCHVPPVSGVGAWTLLGSPALPLYLSVHSLSKSSDEVSPHESVSSWTLSHPRPEPNKDFAFYAE